MADYLTTTSELTSIANAIRTKGGTSAQLTYPNEFISAINAIEIGIAVDDIMIIGDYGVCFKNFSVSGNTCTSAAGTVLGNTLIAI